jgi:hypothetical protein
MVVACFCGFDNLARFVRGSSQFGVISCSSGLLYRALCSSKQASSGLLVVSSVYFHSIPFLGDESRKERKRLLAYVQADCLMFMLAYFKWIYCSIRVLNPQKFCSNRFCQDIPTSLLNFTFTPQPHHQPLQHHNNSPQLCSPAPSPLFDSKPSALPTLASPSASHQHQPPPRNRASPASSPASQLSSAATPSLCAPRPSRTSPLSSCCTKSQP